MVDAGLLRQVPHRGRRRTHFEYHLTEAGADTCSHCGAELRPAGVAWHRPWRSPVPTPLAAADDTGAA